MKTSKEIWAQIQKIGEIRQIKKNEYLLKTGQISHNGYYINSGSLVRTFVNKKGKETIQCFYLDDSYAFLSEITGYVSDIGSSFQIMAIENSEIIEFPSSKLKLLAKNSLELALFLHKNNAMSFHNLYILSAMRLSLQKEEFLQFLYHRYPIYMRRIPDMYIAQFMGISKELLEKLKNNFFKSNFQTPLKPF